MDVFKLFGQSNTQDTLFTRLELYEGESATLWLRPRSFHGWASTAIEIGVGGVFKHCCVWSCMAEPVLDCAAWLNAHSNQS